MHDSFIPAASEPRRERCGPHAGWSVPPRSGDKRIHVIWFNGAVNESDPSSIGS